MATKSTKKTLTKKTSNKTETARWNGHKFIVSSKLIRGFGDLQISGSSDTEQKKKNNQIYIARKSGNPTEISLTAYLNAFTGCDVRKEAIAFVKQAQNGKKDYLYVGKKKLFTYKLLLTDATVNEIEIAHNNTWVNAEVQLSFKQTGTGGKSINSDTSSTGSSGGSAGGGTYSSTGSQKQSVKKSSAVTTKSTKKEPSVPVHMNSTLSKLPAASAFPTGNPSSTKTAVKNNNAAIKKFVNDAKKYTKQKKTTSAGAGAKPNLAARL